MEEKGPVPSSRDHMNLTVAILITVLYCIMQEVVLAWKCVLVRKNVSVK